MSLATFSDVHSNMPALGAVLADIAAAGVDDRYCLGDLVGYAPWPNERSSRFATGGAAPVTRACWRLRFLQMAAFSTESQCRIQ